GRQVLSVESNESVWIRRCSGHQGEAWQAWDGTDYPLRPADEPWDISTSYPYRRFLSKTVTEGTWLRIATHPTREELVFDMLGDLYCMSTSTKERPIQAHAFLSGIPFEKEAAFSHDGSRLVFISDAGFGVDNVWTMPYTSCGEMAQMGPDKARESTVQQTNATFRFFSSPAFHPTEPTILATKWFLTGRPNGAGEIWEFPLQEKPVQRLSEKAGRRVVGRKLPPAWSRDRYFESQLGAEQGRYTASGDGIIFTRNVNDEDAGKFSYNKDVHAGINAVFLFNTTSGRITELVAAAASAPNKPASPGGANMPRLSRDGRTLAFVRRVDDKSVLVLKDMVTGTVHYVWDGLTYDLSTIPAFMGAYPNYGWSVGDKSIIIWSQGKIWEVPLKLDSRGERVANGEPGALPFQATIQLSLGDTRYNANNILQTELSSHRQVRSLRGLRSDHSGQRVVFEAAGDNVVMNIASGELQLLPKPSSSMSCYGPSFIPSESFLLQACWDDQNLTQFVLADSVSQAWRPVHGIPRGRHLSPVSDGSFVAYVRTGKDYMFGDVEETYGAGVWVGSLSLASATVSSLVHLDFLPASQQTKLGLKNVDGETILLVENPTSVIEYTIETGRKRTLVTGKTSVEMTASSKGSKTILAFRDFQHIWLYDSSTTTSQLSVWSKPGDTNTPSNLIRLSEHGGHDVTISGDGQSVFWLFGPQLYSASIQQVLASCRYSSLASRDAGSCSRPRVVERLVNVTFPTALSQQIKASGGQSFAIVNATLVSMDSKAPQVYSNATIVVERGRIVRVGTGAETAIPSGAEVLDVEGGAVLPGFVDMHGHWGGFLTPYPLLSWEMETFLGYGVTTIHNPASKNVGGMVERNLIEKGRMYGPRVFHTGDVLYGSTQPPVYTEINSQLDAKSALLRIKVEGGDESFSVKNYQLVARSARQRLLLAADDLNMLVVPEGGWSLDWDLTYFIDGYTTLEHPVPVPELYDDVLSLIAASGSSYTPLAVMNYGGIFGQHWIHQTVEIPTDPKLRRYLKHDILESLTEVKQAPKSSYQFFNTTKSTAQLAARGVRTNVGAHGEQPIGFLYHSEMLMMSLGGQSPYAVLNHATIGSATSLGLNGSVGSVEVGKLADMVIYPPGTDTIEKVWNSSMHMKYVMRGGTLFAVEDGLAEMWPRRGRQQQRARLNPEDEAM
ncbi:hypothetical protein GQ53DRAFT_881601, partial [Thozetella sp. PMI_491]